MGSAFHQLCPRYSGTLNPTARRLLGYGKPLPLPIHLIQRGGRDKMVALLQLEVYPFSSNKNMERFKLELYGSAVKLQFESFHVFIGCRVPKCPTALNVRQILFFSKSVIMMEEITFNSKINKYFKKIISEKYSESNLEKKNVGLLEAPQRSLNVRQP